MVALGGYNWKVKVEVDFALPRSVVVSFFLGAGSVGKQVLDI